jgi:hypothetical protein
MGVYRTFHHTRSGGIRLRYVGLTPIADIAAGHCAVMDNAAVDFRYWDEASPGVMKAGSG